MGCGDGFGLYGRQLIVKMGETYRIIDKNAPESRILWGVSFTSVIGQTSNVCLNLLQEKFVSHVGYFFKKRGS